MIKITFLGTSGSTPTKQRGMPSVAISQEGKIYLFDCGEGTQMKMLEYGLNISKVDSVFLTHAHGDHIIGIAGLVRTMAMLNRQKELKIYIPKGYENSIINLINFDKAIISYKISVIGIKAGDFYKGDGFTVSAFKVNHQIATYGYVFKEDDKRRFMTEKAVKLGIKGKAFGELQRKGRIKINGKTISLQSVTNLVEGRKIVYTTDTRPSKSTISAARNANVLIHESSYAGDEAKLASQRKHSTSVEAAQIAKAAKVKRLVLIHISARHSSVKEMLNGARKVFPSTTVANDGESISI